MRFIRSLKPQNPQTPIAGMQNPGIYGRVVSPTGYRPVTPNPAPPVVGQQYQQQAPHVVSYNNAPRLAVPPPGMPVMRADPNMLNNQYFSRDPQVPFSIREHRHKALPLGLVVMGFGVLVGLGTAFYQVVLSNQPSFMLRTAVGRTAGAFDQVVRHTVSNTQAGTLKGSYVLEGTVATSGIVNAEFYKNNANFNFDIGQPPARATIVGRLIDSEYSDSPDMYFRATGLQNLGTIAPDYSAALASYDNQWLVIDHSVFDGLKSRYIKLQDTGPQLTPAEINKITNAINKVNRNYLFTSDVKKSVFGLTKQVGRETRDKREVYHYTVKLNKDNAKAYLNAMADALQKTPAANIVAGGKVREAVNFDKLQKEIDGYADNTTAELYVDTETKLIHAIRFADKANKDNYMDIGFRQTDKDHLPFVLTVHNTKDGKTSQMSLRITLNKKTKVTQIDLLTNSVPVGTTGQKFITKLVLTPSTKPLTVKRPTSVRAAFEVGAPDTGKSISELFKTFTINVIPGSENIITDDQPEDDSGSGGDDGGGEYEEYIDIPGGDPGADEEGSYDDEFLGEDWETMEGDGFDNCEEGAEC